MSRSRLRRRLAAAACLPALALGVLAPTSADAAEPWTAPTYVDTFGHPGHAGVYAWGAATAADGSILIGDYWNYAIRRYDAAGTLLQTISSKGLAQGQNMAPHGVAVSPKDGSIYLVDMNAPWEIDVFDAAGTSLRTIKTYVPGVTTPYPYITRVAVSTEGLIYAVNSHNVATATSGPWANIVVYNPDGTYHSNFGEWGTADGQMQLVRGIAIGPRDEVFLADAGRRMVHVFSKDGQFLRSFGSGRFNGDMRGIAIDAARNRVYVVDAAASQIETFRLDTGAFVRAFGSEGTGQGQFRDGGREITVDRSGNVHAPDFGGHRIHVFSPTGTWLRTYPFPAPQPPDDGFNQAQDVDVRPDGTAFYTADTYNHRIQKWNRDGTVAKVWGFRGSTAPMAMNYPRGVAVDPTNGDVLLINSRQGNLKRYTADGAYVTSFGSWGDQDGQFDLPRGLSTDGSRIYVADSNNERVQVFTRTGDHLLTLPCGTPPPRGQGPQLLGGCTGVTTDAAGNIYAAAVSEHVVYKFSSSGQLLGKFGKLGSRNGELRAPYDVEVHDGLLYVSESNNNRISVLTLDGAFVGKFGSKGTGQGQFTVPRGISIDDAGRLYVMDSQNERVVVFDLA